MTAAIASLSILRDLPLRLQLPERLEREVKAYVDQPQPRDDDHAAYVERGITLVERCLAHIEAEASRLTEQRFAMPDPNMLKQRMLTEPRRQADALIAQIKQKLANEKQEWARRVAKQMSDVATTVDQQVESLVMTQEIEKHGVVVTPDPTWQRDFERWKLEVFTRWASHLAPLLQSKTLALLQPELDLVEELLARPVAVVLPLPKPMTLPMGREHPKRHEERFEVPTALDTFFEMFKGNLSTVAMLAGMVVIPVVGSLMHEASTQIRAIVMGSAVAPIVGFAAFNARAQRRKLVAGSRDKARDRLRKSMQADVKAELERFRPDAERYAAQYCNTAQQAVLAVVEPAIQETFERREKSGVAELAKAQLQTEQIVDALNLLRQIKTQLASQLMVDLKRRQVELASRR